MASRPTTAPWGTKRRVRGRARRLEQAGLQLGVGEGGQGERHVVGDLEEGPPVIAGDVGVAELDDEVGAAPGEGAQVLEDVLGRQSGDPAGAAVVDEGDVEAQLRARGDLLVHVGADVAEADEADAGAVAHGGSPLRRRCRRGVAEAPGQRLGGQAGGPGDPVDLVGEGGVEDAGVVGPDDEVHPGVEEAVDGVQLRAGDAAEAQVRAGAGLDDHAQAGQLSEDETLAPAHLLEAVLVVGPPAEGRGVPPPQALALRLQGSAGSTSTPASSRPRRWRRS